jgi:hypothetical protein
MNLPSYFIADLPPEAELTPTMIREACETLKRNRESYLRDRSTAHLIRVLSEVGENWMQPDYPFRRLALEKSPKETGFPPATLARGLDAFFGQLTRPNLQGLVVQDLGHRQRLDEMVTLGDRSEIPAAMACGPELTAIIAPGNVPASAWMSLTLGWLVRSAQFLKCARGTSLLTRLFAHSIHEVEPKLACCVEIAEWPGGERRLEDPLFEAADCVTASGSDEMLAELRGRLPARSKFLGYGHRVSFGFVAEEVLVGAGARQAVRRAVDDVVAWNQQGCLSPHVIFVQTGGAITAEIFAEMLAAELEEREKIEPRGPIPLEEAALIVSRRDFYRIRERAPRDLDLRTRLWCSAESTDWTVVYEGDARFQMSCLNRFIYVKGVVDLTDALHQSDGVRGQVSTVGIAAHEETAKDLAQQLARWGVTRVCPLGRMQQPPLTWRHDGRPGLSNLVTWTDWEKQ